MQEEEQIEVLGVGVQPASKDAGQPPNTAQDTKRGETDCESSSESLQNREKRRSLRKSVHVVECAGRTEASQ